MFALNKKDELKDQTEAFEDEKNAELERMLEDCEWVRPDGKKEPGRCMAPLGTYIERYIEIRGNGSVGRNTSKNETRYMNFLREAA